MLRTRIPTGVGGLDDVLGGGLPRHRLYLVQGEPGVGKTTLALQFLQEGVRLGERVLYITLSETREELEQVCDSHGWTLDGIDLYDLSKVESYLSASASNTVFHPSEVELNETTRSLLALVDEVNPSRAVFDSLSEMRLLASDPLRYRRQILALKQYFADKKCTVLLLDDRTSDPNDLHLQSIAHGVVLLEQTPSTYGVDRRRMRVQKLRGVNFRSGYHDVGMLTGGIRVFPRLIASEHRHDIPESQISSGVESLDNLTGGGLDRGVSNLFLGPAGSGKSTLATLFAKAAAGRDEKAVLYLFEETPRTLYKRSRALGIDLEEMVKSGNIKVQHIDPAELSPGEFVQQVRDDIASGEVSLVIIDSLNGYLNAMPEDGFLILQLHELLMFLGQQGVTSILVVAQHGMMGASMAAPFDVSYLADTVLLFRFFEHLGHIKRAVSILKRRGGEHDQAIRELHFGGAEGIRVGHSMEHLRGVLTGVPVPVTQ
ncbi:MAG TPA: ATPase domain-containing protein [Fimbriimonas sp.]|nr:ATPase domain-containing protein [Fimbriimonas sp.]